MSRTSPVQIINKNGVATTVHKRVDAPAAASNKRSIPMPKLGDDAKFKLMVDHAFEMNLSSHSMSDNVKNKMMDTLHPETMSNLQDILRADISLITLGRAMNLSMKNRNFAVLNTMAILVPEMEDPSVNHQARLMNILVGMQENRKEKTPEVDITNTSDPRSEGVRALVNSILSVDQELRITKTNKRNQQYLTFVHPEVGNLILERPDRADEIVELYKIRKEFDRELFEEILDAGVSALSNGSL